MEEVIIKVIKETLCEEGGTKQIVLSKITLLNYNGTQQEFNDNCWSLTEALRAAYEQYPDGSINILQTKRIENINV